MAETAGSTHPGYKRQDNQDRYLIARLAGGEVLAAVADGVGGHTGGAMAAQTAVQSLENNIQTHGASLWSAFLAAGRAVEQAAESSPEFTDMGTTLTAVLLKKDRLEWSHLGDTRLYLFRNGVLSCLTRDDTAAQELVEDGHLSIEEARQHPTRHMLYECLGCGDCEPSLGRQKVLPGDLIMICSDGLHGELTDEQMSSVLVGGDPLESKANRLIQSALQAGGADNISVVLIRV